MHDDDGSLSRTSLLHHFSFCFLLFLFSMTVLLLQYITSHTSVLFQRSYMEPASTRKMSLKGWFERHIDSRSDVEGSQQSRSDCEERVRHDDSIWNSDSESQRESDANDDIVESDLGGRSRMEEGKGANNQKTKEKTKTVFPIPMLASVTQRQNSNIPSSFRDRPVRSLVPAPSLRPPPPASGSASALPASFVKHLSQSLSTSLPSSPSLQSVQEVHSTTYTSSPSSSTGRHIPTHTTSANPTSLSTYDDDDADRGEEEQEDDVTEEKSDVPEVEEEAPPLLLTGTLLKKSKHLNFWRRHFVVLHVDTGEMVSLLVRDRHAASLSLPLCRSVCLCVCPSVYLTDGLFIVVSSAL